MKPLALLTHCIVLLSLSTAYALVLQANFLEIKNESVELSPDFHNEESTHSANLSFASSHLTSNLTRPLFIPLSRDNAAGFNERQEVATSTAVTVPLSGAASTTAPSGLESEVTSLLSEPAATTGTISVTAATAGTTALSEPSGGLTSMATESGSGAEVSATGLTALTDMTTFGGESTLGQSLPLPVASLYPSTTMAAPTYDPTDENSALYTCLFNAQLNFSTPRDADFEEKIRVWNLISDARPVAYLTPFTDTQVSEAVQCAVGNNRTVTARGGGHSYLGASRGQTGGVVLDLKYMDEVVLSGDMAFIGAGARMGTVYYQLWQQGKRLVPGGTCPQVGAIGLTMGGGQGVSSRMYGVMSDNVIEYNVVLADGQIVTASLEENPRLFWGLRGGGGGNFGIVTRMAIRTHKPPERVSAYLIQIPANLTGDFINQILQFSRKAPPEFGGYFGIASVGVGGYLTYLGPLRDLDFYAYDLLQQWSSPITTTPMETNWLDLYYRVSQTTFPTSSQRRLELTPDFSQPSVYSQIKSLIVRKDDEVPAAVLQALQAEVTLGNPATALINVELLGGNINAIAPSATAFVHRDATLLLEPALTSVAPLTDTDELWLNGIYELLVPYVTGGSYINFADGNLPRPGENFYGSNFGDLQILKKVWDPQNVFNFSLSINNLGA